MARRPVKRPEERALEIARQWGFKKEPDLKPPLEQALTAAGSHMEGPNDWLDLAIECLDQAGVPLNEQLWFTAELHRFRR